MRNLITFATLSVVATGLLGGVASANSGHREPVRAPARTIGREPVRQVEHREPIRREVRNDHDRDDRRFNDRDRDDRRFETVRYERPIGDRYFDVRFRPAPLVEDYGISQPGYIWVTGDWQWNGAEWIWVAGHYVAAY